MYASNPVIHSSRTERKIKVLIVDDSSIVRNLFTKWLSETPGIEVVASCTNGLTAITKSRELVPDIVVLDIDMPEMGGVEALSILIKENPNIKVIMASKLTRKDAEISLRALSLGAADYIPKPESRYSMASAIEFRHDLINKIKAIGENNRRFSSFAGGQMSWQSSFGKKNSKSENLGSELLSPSLSNEKFTVQPFNPSKPKVLAIGSSTGGPQALPPIFEIIAKTVNEKGISIFVTQHMPPTFTTILADNLKKSSGINCKEGVDGEEVIPGTCYVAPGGLHMLVSRENNKIMIKLDDGPPVNYCKPAVDMMFDSIAETYGSSVLAMVLTGMGYDGASGIMNIRKSGGNILAQDEASSVIWGMPGAAAKTGLCSAILPLEKLGKLVVNRFGGSL